MGKIHIQAADVWAFWQKNRDSLITTPRTIAENPEYGVVVELATSPGNTPEVTVFADDDEVSHDIAYGAADCNAMVMDIYTDYITANAGVKLAEYYKTHDKQPEPDDDDAESGKDRAYQIDFREEELKTAVFDLLTTVFTDTDIPKIDGITDEVLEWFLEALHKKYEFPIYRPMILEDDDGEFFEEYPYEHLVFEEGSA